MLKKSRYFNLNKVISILLIFMIIFQLIVASFGNIDLFADVETANDRVMNSINLSKSKSFKEIDTTKITDDDIQVLGVFLSNFYQPWSSEVITTTDDDAVKERQVNALVSTCGFDESVAKFLVEVVWQKSVNSAQPLYLGRFPTDEEVNNKKAIRADGTEVAVTSKREVIDECAVRDAIKGVYYGNYSGHSDNPYNDNGKTKATYFSFLDWFSGLKHDKTHGGDGSTTTSFTVGLNDHFINLDAKICLYWEDDNGVKHPVFDTRFDYITFTPENWASNSTEKYTISYDSMIYTPSTIMYSLIMDEINYKKGIGSSIIDCTYEQYNELSDEDKNRAIVLNSDLYVDCFGNILVDTGFQKFVLFPACANPYTWAKKQDGSDAGYYANVVNLFALGEAEANCITGEVTDKGKLQYTFKFDCSQNTLLSTGLWRIKRGEEDVNFDEDWLIGLGDNEDIKKDIMSRLDKYVYKQSDVGLGGAYNDGNQKYVFPNFSAYYSNPNYEGYTNSSGKYSHKTTNLITDFIQIDNIKAWKGDNEDYSTFKKYDGGIFALDSDGKTCKALASSKSKFTDTLSPGKLIIPTGIEAQKYLTGIWCSYVLAYFNDGTDKFVVDYYFSKNQYPKLDSSQIDFSSIEISNSAEEMQQELQSMLYYLAHPSEGVAYVANWFKTKIGGILTSWHEDMAGNSGAANTTGSTKYLGFSGYVTLPTLTDVKWTALILENYNNFVVYMIILIFIILLSYCVIGQMTFQRAIIGTLAFSIMAFLPPLAINSTANSINSVCDKIYGNKFTYWAVVQHATYLSDLKRALEDAKEGFEDGYLHFLFSNQEGLDTDNYAKVKLKWLSPKKMRSTADDAEELIDDMSNNSLVIGTITNNLINKQYGGEEYLNSSESLYLYRDYADIYMYSSVGYNTQDWYDNNNLKVNESDLAVYSETATKLKYSSGMTMYDIFVNDDQKAVDDIDYSSPYWYKHGFCINTGDSNFESKNHYSNKHYNFLLDSQAYPKIAKANSKLLNRSKDEEIVLSKKSDINDNSYGLLDSEFKIGLTQMRDGFDGRAISDIGDENSPWKLGFGPYFYSLYSESPFYFFTWNILDQELSTEFASTYNSAERNKGLLDVYTTNSQSYFYNYSEDSANGFGEMRDFCDMHGLFYYVIPYLKACNEGVLEWSKLYGTDLYDDVKVRYDTDGNPENIPDPSKRGTKNEFEFSDEYINKWWHNYNVNRLFNTYTAWVDLMYACDYSHPETINILGEKFVVQDPLDPTSYFTTDAQGAIESGRPMIFSRSEMAYYGLNFDALTTVEQKIINVQDKVYNNLLQLMDYYELGDKIDMNEVLTTAAGMLTTFAFNEEFSQSKPVGESYTLYPQSYELKAFSYDAYLRLIMSGSTGESLLDTNNSMSEKAQDSTSETGKKSYYQRIVEKSSITTALLYVILDIIAIYMIPVLKMFFLVALFIMSVLMIISAVIRLHEEDTLLKTVYDALIEPLVKFSLVTIGLAWLVSMFMSNGNTSVTKRDDFVIALGDPAMVLIAMIIINAVALILYYKICKDTFKKMMSFLKAVVSSVGGSLLGAVGKVFGAGLAGKLISDSVARGTAKARGKQNQPNANNGNGNGKGKGSGSGEGEGSGGGGSESKSESEPKAPEPKPAPVHDSENDEKEEKKRAMYNSLASLKKEKEPEKQWGGLNKEESHEVNELNKKADRNKAIENTLNGSKLKDKSKELHDMRKENYRKHQDNVSRLRAKEKNGDKLTLSERSYLKRFEVSDKMLSTGSKACSKASDKMSDSKLAKEFGSRAELARSDANNALNYYRKKNVANQKATITGQSRRERNRADAFNGRAENANGKRGKSKSQRKKEKNQKLMEKKNSKPNNKPKPKNKRSK